MSFSIISDEAAVLPEDMRPFEQAMRPLVGAAQWFKILDFGLGLSRELPGMKFARQTMFFALPS